MSENIAAIVEELVEIERRLDKPGTAFHKDDLTQLKSFLKALNEMDFQEETNESKGREYLDVVVKAWDLVLLDDRSDRLEKNRSDVLGLLRKTIKAFTGVE